jgi:uncharacterized protein DUF3501
MQPLTIDDLLPLDEFIVRRREYFDAQCRYADRYRRVRVGHSVSLLFENRQTLWFRIQEVLRVSRLADPGRVQGTLDLYNRLLPGPNQLHAALVIDIAEGPGFLDELRPWQKIQGEDVRLIVGPERLPSQLVTCRPQDRCFGAAHWIRFAVDARARAILGDLRHTTHVEIQAGDLQYTSPPLSDDLRQSLVDDLRISDRR